MTNPQLGFAELAAAQEQPEVVVNAATRVLSAALAGELTVDFESDGNLTLASNDPPTSADQWPYGTLIFTDSGPILTAARDIIYPNVDAITDVTASRIMFEVVNQTAEDLTIKRTGETGVTVAAGTRALVKHNGTDIVAMVNPLP